MTTVLIIITVLSICFGLYCLNHKLTQDRDIEKQNKSLLDYNADLIRQKELHEIEYAEQQKKLNDITKSVNQREFELRKLRENIEVETTRLTSMTEGIDEAYKSREEMSQKAFEKYWETLMQSYKEKDEEYDRLLETLRQAYEKEQLDIIAALDKENAELDKIRSTRIAALEAQIKEKQVKEELAFYCLPLSDIDKADIDILETIKPKLNKPRVLSMLIWSSFFQKPMTTLCNNILGTTQVTGIYKITNQKNNMCYIGQAVDIADRWKQHAKCGLGIDTPAANKLYKAMQEDGINNFSWELIEKCPREQLNEKEKYYIELYDAYNFGYNSNTGIKK